MVYFQWLVVTVMGLCIGYLWGRSVERQLWHNKQANERYVKRQREDYPQ